MCCCSTVGGGSIGDTFCALKNVVTIFHLLSCVALCAEIDFNSVTERQEMSIKSHDEALISSSSRCPALVEEFPMSLWEGYSPSPNSVLEPPFSEEISLDSDTFQVAGANLQGM